MSGYGLGTRGVVYRDRPTQLWRFYDFGAMYKCFDLLTYSAFNFNLIWTEFGCIVYILQFLML